MGELFIREMGKWGSLTKQVERFLRLKTFPVAMKLLEDPEELKRNKWVRKLDRKATLCQLITKVRTFDWTVGATAEDLFGHACSAMLGLTERPPEVMDGTFRSLVWVKTKEDGKKYEQSIPTIPTGKFKAVMLAPLLYDPFDPDIILIYANPAQMILLINSIQFENYERLQFFCVGESSCSDAIAQCYLTNKLALAIPCYGERRYGHAQDDELVMALPPDMLGKVVKGLLELYKRGVRYPISYYGAECDPTEGLGKAYGML
jgi:uncharacterized protein (DUF169 family)